MSTFFNLSLAQFVNDTKERIKDRNRLLAIRRKPQLVLKPPFPATEEPFYPLPEPGSFAQQINSAILNAQNYILSQQDESGFWWEVLDTNTTLTSEFILTSHFMGMVDPQLETEACNYLLQQQQKDGGWPIFYNGPSDLSTTIEAYFALKLSGHDSDAPYMQKARDLILFKGGILKARVFTKINLALFGQFPWSGVPVMPPQLMLLPKGFTFNIYEFSSWARVVIVPMTILMTKKPVIPIPHRAWVEELYLEPLGKRDYHIQLTKNLISTESLFIHLDKTMKIIEKLPFKPFVKTSLKKAEKWILDHQDHSGDWGGILPAMMNSIMALKCQGYSNNHPVIQKGWKAILRFQDRKEGMMHQQSCISPIWDTAWYAIALAHSRLPKNHPSLQKSTRYLLDKQILREGDWKIKNPKGEPGGWAFEFDNDFYPDVDDTLAVLTSLLFTDVPEKDRVYKAFSKGVHWVLSMQNDDGGWAAFERHINKKILNEIPFADLKSLLDPSTCDITGRVLEFLGLLGYNNKSRLVKRAIRFIKQNQHEQGSWWGRWGVNYIYGTWCVLVGLKAVGEDMNQEYIQKAARWLKSIQNTDGGWGESCQSYEDENYMGVGKSTPSQTAWALMGLMAAGERRFIGLRRGIEYLLSQQIQDGSWKEEEYTGTGFPKHFYLGYRGYKNYFSLLALSHYKSLVQ